MGRGQWAEERGEDRGEDVRKILKLLSDQEEMQRMSHEAKDWSQQYTLERFEEAIKEVLIISSQKKSVKTGPLSPAPFRASPEASGDGVKRGKSKE